MKSLIYTKFDFTVTQTSFNKAQSSGFLKLPFISDLCFRQAIDRYLISATVTIFEVVNIYKNLKEVIDRNMTFCGPNTGNIDVGYHNHF